MLWCVINSAICHIIKSSESQINATNQYIITWLLHRILMYSDKMLLAGG